jgi:hypothetical protein
MIGHESFGGVGSGSGIALCLSAFQSISSRGGGAASAKKNKKESAKQNVETQDRLCFRTFDLTFPVSHANNLQHVFSE